MNIRQFSLPTVGDETEMSPVKGFTLVARGASIIAGSIKTKIFNFILSIAEIGKKIVLAIKVFFLKIKNVLKLSFSMLGDRLHSRRMERNTDGISSINKKPKFFSKKTLRLLVILVLAVVILGGGIAIVRKLRSGHRVATTSASSNSVLGAKASQDLNTDFDFPVKNSKGDKVASFKFTIESAELRDQIIVKGQSATAVAGRTFLIINLKIANSEDKAVNINTRDYVRLSVNDNKDEWLAPDIHNDPVEVQAISTKYTRVGFPINNSDKDLVLRVGEIDGDKKEINLNLN